GHDSAHVAEESLAVHWPHYAAYEAGEALIRQMRALDVHDTLAVSPQLPKLRGTPARVIWGASDQFQKVEYGERFARDLGISLERIDGGKHFTPEDHPERIAAALQSLVAEVEARGNF
nr:alpha/beta hydrolase [Gemmatimonadaceae bacterium]